MRPPVRDAFYEPLDVKAFWRARGIDPDDESQRELGRVERASFGSHDHGGHTVTLMFNFGGSGQGWPSYELSTCHKVGEDRSPILWRPMLHAMDHHEAVVVGIAKANRRAIDMREDGGNVRRPHPGR